MAYLKLFLGDFGICPPPTHQVYNQWKKETWRWRIGISEKMLPLYKKIFHLMIFVIFFIILHYKLP